MTDDSEGGAKGRVDAAYGSSSGRRGFVSTGQVGTAPEDGEEGGSVVPPAHLSSMRSGLAPAAFGGGKPAFVRWRVALLMLSMFQTFVGAGIVYGWPFLELSLIDAGVYSSECTTTTSSTDLGDSTATPAGSTGGAGCPAQLLKLNYIYVAASWGVQAGGLVGFLLDAAGIKLTITSTSAALALAAGLFGFSSEALPAWLPALTIMGAAGNGVFMSGQLMGMLFPKNPNLARFCVTAAFAPGNLVFMFFHFVTHHLHWTSLRVLFLCYAGFQCVLTLISAVVWPHTFEYVDPTKSFANLKEGRTPSLAAAAALGSAASVGSGSRHGYMSSSRSNAFMRSGRSHRSDLEYGSFRPEDYASADGSEKPLLSETDDAPAGYVSGKSSHRTTTKGKSLVESGIPEHEDLTYSADEDEDELFAGPATFWQQLRDPRFIFATVFFSVLMLPAQFYIGTLNLQIAPLSDSHAQTDNSLNIFNIIYIVVSLMTPAIGWLTDRIGFGGSSTFVALMYIGSFAIITFAPSLPWFTPSYVIYGFARNGQFSVFCSYIGHAFGSRHMGKLMGIGFLISAMVSLLQAPLLHFVVNQLDGRYKWGNTFLMATVGALLTYCVWLVSAEWRERQRNKRLVFV